MNYPVPKFDTQDIVVEEFFPHAPETLWAALTSGEMIKRWLMAPTGFAPEQGRQFTFQTTPAGAWDGVIRCQVLEVVPNERFAFSWQGGDESNDGSYGSRLDTVVSFTLTRQANGTRLRLVHAGFVTPKNDSAFRSMGEGWKKVVPSIGEVAKSLH